MNMDFEKKLKIPMEIKKEYPLPNGMSKIVDNRAKVIKDIFDYKSDKFILIIGPCSADSTDSVLDYMTRLKCVQEKVRDKIFIIPRLYTNKSRTVANGYLGMLHQPNCIGKPDVFKGIIAVRELYIKVLQETEFTCADEMLYPENYKYTDDLVAYVTVGARSVENQQHRLTASGVEVPVGMKNPTSGNLSVMLNAILTAKNEHDFIYRGWKVHSYGNNYAHSVLRGYTNKNGQFLPNYHYEDLLLLYDLYKKSNISKPSVIVDVNHANSGKNFFEQIRIVKEVLYSSRCNANIKTMLKGFMIESYIQDGSQKVGESCYGKSITDPCLGWEKTEKLIYEIADLL